MPASNKSHNGSRMLETVTMTIRVIQLLEERNGARATDIADELDISKSSVYNHLTTLVEHGLVSKRRDVYHLSYRFVTLGEFVRNQSTIYRYGHAEVENLSEETGEYAHLTVEQNGLGVNLYKVRGDDAVGADFQTERVQKPDYLHYSATGKSILAHLSKQRLDEIVDQHGLPGRTENTITDREALYEHLETVREQGFAYNDSEEVRGIRAVGAPIISKDDRVLGAVSVSGPESRLQGVRFTEELPSRIKSAANIIEVNLNTAVEESEFPSF
jgi:DNA-binding IclR family transcriptional regulator